MYAEVGCRRFAGFVPGRSIGIIPIPGGIIDGQLLVGTSDRCGALIMPTCVPMEGGRAHITPGCPGRSTGCPGC